MAMRSSFLTRRGFGSLRSVNAGHRYLEQDRTIFAALPYVILLARLLTSLFMFPAPVAHNIEKPA